MRLALLGPCDDDVPSLARAAYTALVTLHADRVVYLSADGAIDAVVHAWAELLGALEPLAERAGSLIDAPASAIDEAVERERARQRLSVVRTLAGPALRSVELLHDRVVLLCEDKRDLDEEDLLPATFIVFGRGEPVIRRVGSRVFLCPGSTAKRTEGIVLLDEGAAAGSILATIHSVDGAVAQRELLETARSAKLKVQGA